MRAKSRILFAILMALCMMFVVACNNDTPQPDPTNGNGDGTPAIEYVTVNVVGGQFKGSSYTRDFVEKGTSVTVVSQQRTGNAGEEFVSWNIKGDVASTALEYTLTVNEDTTITAVYGIEYDVWDGEYPSEAPASYEEDEANHVININGADALAYFAKHISSVNMLDTNSHKYSSFDWTAYDAAVRAGTNVNTAREEATQPAWTLNINRNLDMGGYDWAPIMDMAWGMHDITFEGNNNIIKNLHPVAYADGGNNNSGSMKSGGFIGQISSSVAFQNITFDNAVTSIPAAGSNYQHLGIIIGYAHGANVMNYTNKYQTLMFDNVSVLNSTIVGSANSAKHGMFIARLGGGPAEEASHLIIKNSRSIGNTTIGGDLHSALLGNVWQLDLDPANNPVDSTINTRNIIVIDAYNNIVEDFTAITTVQGNATKSSYMAATLATWDYWDNGVVYNTVYNTEYGDPSVTTINLHVGGGVMNGTVLDHSPLLTDSTILVKSVTNGSAPNNLFVACNITLSQSQQDTLEEWTQPSTQYIYMVGGATVTGHTFNNVRYINGDRNANGNLIVRDADGEVIGAWVITNFAGAFVAA